MRMRKPGMTEAASSELSSADIQRFLLGAQNNAMTRKNLVLTPQCVDSTEPLLEMLINNHFRLGRHLSVATITPAITVTQSHPVPDSGARLSDPA